MFTKLFRILIRLVFLPVIIVSIFIYIKLPNYTGTMKYEIVDLNKYLSMLERQKKYEILTKQSIYGDRETIKMEILPQIEEEQKILTAQKKSLSQENRLLTGHLNILTTKIIFDTKLNLIKIVRNEKILSDIVVAKKFVDTFLKSEINKKTLNIVAKKKNPSTVKPKWTYNDITDEVPAENSAQRIMIGSLGNYAIYFNDFLIIHDYVKNTQQHDMINHICVQINKKNMKKLYNSVFIGSKLYVE